MSFVLRVSNALVHTALIVSILFFGIASAQVEIEIIADEGSKIPITVLPFVGEEEEADLIAEIISADLTKTGLFSIQDVETSWGLSKLKGE
ncbi:MAG: hypothetical protein P8N01_03775, partial [Burkholderiales bacterium]|nr:hypothetical protein [Burkholderiales bacterium]